MDLMATILAAGLVVYAAIGLAVGIAFVVAGATAVQPAPVTVGAEAPPDRPAAIDVRIRAFGTCAFLMLTIILIVAAPGGERIAVFRDGKQIGALTNLCSHQNGPIGEGRIVDGCVTCPWHGWQYRLADGRAPPPFTEKLATYPVRFKDGMVEVNPTALPPGTPAAITVQAS